MPRPPGRSPAAGRTSASSAGDRGMTSPPRTAMHASSRARSGLRSPATGHSMRSRRSFRPRPPRGSPGSRPERVACGSSAPPSRRTTSFPGFTRPSLPTTARARNGGGPALTERADMGREVLDNPWPSLLADRGRRGDRRRVAAPWKRDQASAVPMARGSFARTATSFKLVRERLPGVPVARVGPSDASIRARSPNLGAGACVAVLRPGIRPTSSAWRRCSAWLRPDDRDDEPSGRRSGEAPLARARSSCRPQTVGRGHRDRRDVGGLTILAAGGTARRRRSGGCSRSGRPRREGGVAVLARHPRPVAGAGVGDLGRGGTGVQGDPSAPRRIPCLRRGPAGAGVDRGGGVSRHRDGRRRHGGARHGPTGRRPRNQGPVGLRRLGPGRARRVPARDPRRPSPDRLALSSSRRGRPRPRHSPLRTAISERPPRRQDPPGACPRGRCRRRGAASGPRASP